MDGPLLMNILLQSQCRLHNVDVICLIGYDKAHAKTLFKSIIVYGNQGGLNELCGSVYLAVGTPLLG